MASRCDFVFYKCVYYAKSAIRHDTYHTMLEALDNGVEVNFNLQLYIVLPHCCSVLLYCGGAVVLCHSARRRTTPSPACNVL